MGLPVRGAALANCLRERFIFQMLPFTTTYQRVITQPTASYQTLIIYTRRR